MKRISGSNISILRRYELIRSIDFYERAIAISSSSEHINYESIERISYDLETRGLLSLSSILNVINLSYFKRFLIKLTVNNLS